MKNSTKLCLNGDISKQIFSVICSTKVCACVIPSQCKNIHTFLSVYDKNNSQSVRYRMWDKIGSCELYLQKDFAGETDTTIFLLSEESRFISEDE